MLWKWFVFFACLVVYVLVFNTLAKKYFDSNQTFSWKQLYREYVPETTITL